MSVLLLGGSRIVGSSPSPPPPSGAFAPNEPAGFTNFADVTFDATFDNTDVGGPTTYTYKGLDVRKFANQKSTVVTDASAPSGTGYKFAVKWLNGQTDGYGSQIDPAAYDTEKNHIFAAFTFQPGAGFVYETNTYKVFYPSARVDASPTTGSKAYLGIRSTPGLVTDGRCQLSLEQFFRWNGSSYEQPNLFNNMNGYTEASPYWLNNSTFYRIELELKMETPNITSGPQDGIARVWVSEWTGSAWTTPVLTHEYTDVRFGGTTATTSKVFARVNMWDFYRGGGGTPTLTADQFLYMDRVYFSAVT